MVVAVTSLALGVLATWGFGRVQQLELLKKQAELRALLTRKLEQLADILRGRKRVSLQEEFLMTQLLGQKLKSEYYMPDVIFAVVPGGLMISDWLSRRELGSRDKPIPVRTVNVQQVRQESGFRTKTVEVVDNIEDVTAGLLKTHKVLIVIDISRGGETLARCHEFLNKYFHENNIQIAVLFCEKDRDTKIRFFVTKTKYDVVFDWKLNE